MAPLHVSPSPAIGIVLEKQVVFALVKHQPVRVIGPAAPRGEVKLRAQLLMIERIRILDLVRLVDGTQACGITGQLVHRDRRFLATEGPDVHEGPPIRFAVGQFNRELVRFLTLDGHTHLAFGPAGFHRQVEIVSFKSQLAGHIEIGHRRLAVGLHEVVHQEVPRAAGGLVHHLDHRGLADEFAHVPEHGIHVLPFVVNCFRAGGRANHLAVYQQVQADPAAVLASADQKADELALNLERRRGERTGGSVTVMTGIDQALALEAEHGDLLGQGTGARAGPERLARHLPVAVVRRFEISDEQVRLRPRGRS